jgi:hypothetical protein
VVEGFPFPIKHPKDYGVLQLKKIMDSESLISVRGRCFDRYLFRFAVNQYLF